MTPLLAVAGFGAGGVQAGISSCLLFINSSSTNRGQLYIGSAAAAIHAGIGNVAVGSAFSIGQSAGAGGAGLAIVNGIAQVGGAAVAVGGTALGVTKAVKKENETPVEMDGEGEKDEIR